MSAPEFEQRHTSDDLGHFFKGWIRNPLSVGAVAPSGRSLAKLMAKGVGATSRVIELGAGTGKVSEALLASGVRPENLYLVECDQTLVKILRRRFPQCHVLAADVLDLTLQFDATGYFDFVVSGLPLLCFSPEKRYRVLRQALEWLKLGGRIHQFTYAGRCPFDRDSRSALRVDSRLLGVAPLNLPPGFVYCLTRTHP